MPDNDSSANNSQALADDDWLNSAAEWWSQALSEAGAGFRRRLDAAAKKPPPSVAGTAPLSDFDQDFFALVEPKLTGTVRLSAYMAGKGIESFSNAHVRVMNVARRYGAMHLSDTAFFALNSWIDRALLAMLDEPPPDGVISLERLAAITRSPSGEPR